MKLLKIEYFAFIIVFNCFFISCKTTKKATSNVDSQINETDVLIKQNRLDDANDKLEILYKLYPTNAEIVRRFGLIKYHRNDKWGAFPLLVKADSLYGGSNIDLIYSISLCAFEIGKYEMARVYVDRYILVSNDEQKKGRALLMKNRIEKLSDYIKDSTVVFIQSLPNTINTENDEFLAFPTLDNQTLLFTRRYKTGLKVEERLMSSQLIRNEWVESEYFEDFVIATGALSGDGNILVSTTCERDQSIGSCDIMIAYRQNGRWSKPKNMSDLINSIEWDAQPTISSDGKMIFFSSSRRGGKGGRDIYFTTRGPNGWQAPISISDNINSIANEESPFIHADNKTLYFRSDREDGLGSYDNYISRYDELTNTWSTPENLGYPINTVGDDGALTIGADGVTAYMTSDRGSLNNQKPNFDIFTFQMPSDFIAKPTSYVKIVTRDAITNNSLVAKVKILETETSEVVYDDFMTSQGEMILPLASDKEFSILVYLDNYIPVSQVFFPTRDNSLTNPLIINSLLEKIKNEISLVFNNILFETGSAKLKRVSDIDLTYLVNLLKSKPAIKIKITGHTDSTGDAQTNQKLSESRAKAVAEYLQIQGIQTSRIQTSGKGDKEPIADNLTEEGRRWNRRTEVLIVNE
jgi:outer membrane protein OmpA-like peptidoglycan-associated protein/tetratricopeptide (TPR) repeat protein